MKIKYNGWSQLMNSNKYNFLSIPTSVNDRRNLKVRLNFLKAMITSGSYNVSSEKIAENIFNDQLLYLMV